MANTANIVERGVDGVAFEKPIPASQPGDVFPAGVVVDFAGSAAPTGWLICDGSAVSRATYPQLFANIGTTHGAGDGSTTFNLPDCRGKQTVGKHSSGTFVTLGATGGAETSTLGIANMPPHNHGGATGTGTTGTDSPDHGHSVNDPGHFHANLNSWVDDSALTNGSHQWGTAGSTVHVSTNLVDSRTTGISVGGATARHAHSVPALSIPSQGSGTAFNTTDPYIVLNKIIRAY